MLGLDTAITAAPLSIAGGLRRETRAASAHHVADRRSFGRASARTESTRLGGKLKRSPPSPPRKTATVGRSTGPLRCIV